MTSVVQKPLNKEEKRWDYFEKKMQELENNQRVFAMNMGSIARKLGLSAKDFVNCLYEEEKNKDFYIKTLIHEEKLRTQPKKKSFFSWLKEKFYGKNSIDAGTTRREEKEAGRGEKTETSGEGEKEAGRER